MEVAALISTQPANGKRSGRMRGSPDPPVDGKNYSNFTNMNPI
jgi:hypothetical protein